MSNTRIVLNLQSDLSLTGATFGEPTIYSPTGLVQGDISGLTSSLSNLQSEDTSIDSRISVETSTRTSGDTSLTTRISIEESARTSADTSITTRVSGEESTRLAEDTSFNDRIQGFNSGSYQYVSFTGTIDDNNTSFTNTTTDLSAVTFTQVYLNGLLQDSNDYTVALGSTISTLTFNDAPEVGAKIKVLTFWSPTLSYDADALAFFIVTGISDSNQKSAINQLVLNLKSYGLWNKLYAVYPFVGGSAETHKYNLRNPLDTDAAYRLVFNGGWIHSSTGILGNGINTFANTNLRVTILPQNNAHLSVYSRTNSSGNYIDIGAQNTANSFSSYIQSRNGGNNFQGRLNTNGFVQASISNSDSKGFYIVNRQNSTNITAGKNGSVTSFVNSSITANLDTRNYWIGNINSNAVSYPSNREYAFASLGEGFTSTEAANYYTAVQAYQTALGRQV